MLERHTDPATGDTRFAVTCVGKNSMAVNEAVFSSADGPVEIVLGDMVLVGPVALYFLPHGSAAEDFAAALPEAPELAVHGGSMKKRVEAFRVQEKVDRLFSSSPASWWKPPPGRSQQIGGDEIGADAYATSRDAQHALSEVSGSVPGGVPEWEETLAALHLSDGRVYLMKQPVVVLGRSCKRPLADVAIGKNSAAQSQALLLGRIVPSDRLSRADAPLGLCRC